MKKAFWLFLFVCATGLSGYPVDAMTLNKFLDSDWWKTATVEKVEKEIQNGDDVNAENADGETALMWAARNDNPEIVKTLIAAGADVNVENKNGYTVLSYSRNPEILKALLTAGAKISAKDKDHIIGRSSSPHYNPRYNKKNADISEVVKPLVVLGLLDAKDSSGKTALLWSVDPISYNPEMAKALLAAGADTSIKDDKGNAAWDYMHSRLAIGSIRDKKQEQELVKAFVDAGIGKHNFEDWPLISLEGVKIFLATGIDVNTRYKNGMTVLMSAAIISRNNEVIKTLIAAGADVNARNKYGKTALDYAKDNHNSAVAETLIAAGAK